MALGLYVITVYLQTNIDKEVSMAQQGQIPHLRSPARDQTPTPVLKPILMMGQKDDAALIQLG
ncbi:hypothetical protein CK507_10885 [Pseudomonas sp. WN033]|nr:hypothetical protein CK507_10885 [Pseudomonas sp. WN033]